MSSASIKRNAFRTLLVLHFIGLALIIGVRFANFGIEHATGGGSLQVLALGRDLMGVLARTLTLPGFLLTLVTGIGMVILRYGRRVPGWVWLKVTLTAVSLALATSMVAPALEAARKWAHWSVEHGLLAPQVHDSVAQVTLYGGIVFVLILLTIPVAVWKPLLSFGSSRRAEVKKVPAPPVPGQGVDS
jgi:hypothetical protein